MGGGGRDHHPGLAERDPPDTMLAAAAASPWRSTAVGDDLRHLLLGHLAVGLVVEELHIAHGALEGDDGARLRPAHELGHARRASIGSAVTRTCGSAPPLTGGSSASSSPGAQRACRAPASSRLTAIRTGSRSSTPSSGGRPASSASASATVAPSGELRVEGLGAGALAKLCEEPNADDHRLRLPVGRGQLGRGVDVREHAPRVAELGQLADVQVTRREAPGDGAQ